MGIFLRGHLDCFVFQFVVIVAPCFTWEYFWAKSSSVDACFLYCFNCSERIISAAMLTYKAGGSFWHHNPLDGSIPY